MPRAASLFHYSISVCAGLPVPFRCWRKGEKPIFLLPCRFPFPPCHSRESGALAGADLEAGKQKTAATWKNYGGDHRRAFWHLDLDLAKANEAFHANLYRKKPQFVTLATLVATSNAEMTRSQNMEAAAHPSIPQDERRVNTRSHCRVEVWAGRGKGMDR